MTSSRFASGRYARRRSHSGPSRVQALAEKLRCGMESIRHQRVVEVACDEPVPGDV